MTRWFVSHSDILDSIADALICSANPNLNLSGGVGGALLQRYGVETQHYLHAYLRSIGKRHIEPGQAVLSPSCNTPFKAVAHAVAIDVFYESRETWIRSAYENAFHQLASLQCRTLAAACLGCGYGRCTIEDFGDAIRPLLQKQLFDFETITFYTTNRELADALREWIDNYGLMP